MQIRGSSERGIPDYDVPKLFSSCSPSSDRTGLLWILLHKIQGQSKMLQVGFLVLYELHCKKTAAKSNKFCRILQTSKTSTARIKKLEAVFFTVQSL